MTGWQHGYAASGGERIYWEKAGEGAPIVICHGAGSNHLSFFQQIAGLADDGTQVILWDQRGYGNSTFTSDDWGIATGASDLSAVLDAVGLAAAPIHLAGQALGALVAARWAVSNPERVLSLALWDGPFAPIKGGRELGWQLKPDDTDVQATLVDRRLGWTRSVGADFAARDPVRTYLYQTFQEVGNQRPPYSRTFAAAQAEPVSIAALAALPAPILLGRGEHDHVADPAAYVELAAHLPNATVETLPGAGHSPYFERPAEWNAAMRRHVGRVGN
ncbi:alpha/beta fold hydrolase [Rhizorhabdus dicambivorans]|uniref:alpha/beta fold hydrolase n=1 Tax=Rhizorhabdus dicambivorans TaxID=1850238 RepID=UPI001597030A|nr:alpha/beta hydrolase [Rhizorhabdus dicambivorans]